MKRKTSETTVKTTSEARKLGAKEKTAVALITLSSAALFAALALSNLPNYAKAPSLLAELAATGLAIQRITGLEGYAGLIVLRARRGFKFIDELAKKIASPAKTASETGLSIGFGALYAAYAFHENKKKLFIHLTAILVFSLLITAGGEQVRNTVLLVSIPFGLVGLGVFSLATHALNIVTVPTAAPGVYPVIPGLTPGIPFVEGVIALVVIVVVHELAHGVLCRAEKLELKSNGVLFLGFLPIGAFVEPDEEKLKRLAVEKKRRIFGAGSTSNLVFFLVFIALAFIPMTLYPFTVEVVEVQEVLKESPAEGKLFEGDAILAADNVAVKNSGDLGSFLRTKREGDEINLLVSRTYGTAAGKAEEKNVSLALGKEGKLGIVGKDIPKRSLGLAFEAIVFTYRTFYVTYTLNFALALVNLLPLFITDGHRILEDELVARLGSKREKLAKKIARIIGMLCLALILINIVPWFR